VAWAPRQHVRRLPATYTRPHKTRYFLGAYDVRRDHLLGIFRRHQTWQECLELLQAIRARYPRHERLHVVLDNRKSHACPPVLDFVQQNNMRLVFTPTYSSWLNRIECHFTAIKKHALAGRYFENHRQQNAAIRAYLHYRNQRSRQPFENRH
jgi:transposase